MSTMYYGEQKTHTPNELNFMVRAYANCQRNQKAGICSQGEECAVCKWGVAIQEATTLDALTQARLEDKADSYISLSEAIDKSIERGKKKDKVKLLSAIFFIVLFLFCMFFVVSKVSNIAKAPTDDLEHCTQVLPKYRTLPPNPLNGCSYAYDKYVDYVMQHLRSEGPFSYGGDGVIDCKDWTMSFVYLWYEQFDAPDGTCIIVRNVNQYRRFDHCFVAIWNNSRWVCIEPQACNRRSYTLEQFWGDDYNEGYNCYNETRKFCEWAYIESAAERIIKRSRVDDIYTVFYWDDTHPIQYHTDVWR